LVIRPKAPFDFSRMFKRLEKAKDALYQVADGTLIRTIRFGDRIVLVQIGSEGTVGNPVVRVNILQNPGDVPAGLIDQRIAHMLSAYVDLEPFYRHAEQLPDLAGLTAKFYGMRMLLEPDPFECMIKTIVGQQLNLAFADTLIERLVRAACAPLEYQGKEYLVFPSPDQVARLSCESLRQLQFSARKAEYVIDFAKAVVAGHIDWDILQNMSNEEIIRFLTRFRGIGRWTAECFLLFGLGRADLLPAADIGLRNAVKRWYGLSGQPSEQEVRKLGLNWSPWSSYYTYYLWESLNG